MARLTPPQRRALTVLADGKHHPYHHLNAGLQAINNLIRAGLADYSLVSGHYGMYYFITDAGRKALEKETNP